MSERIFHFDLRQKLSDSSGAFFGKCILNSMMRPAAGLAAVPHSYCLTLSEHTICRDTTRWNHILLRTSYKDA